MHKEICRKREKKFVFLLSIVYLDEKNILLIDNVEKPPSDSMYLQILWTINVTTKLGIVCIEVSFSYFYL